MKRFYRIVLNELRLFRTALAFHLIAIFQPTLMFILLGIIMVEPTFDMYVVRPVDGTGWALIDAMGEVGSPIGAPYINPIVLDEVPAESHQLIEVHENDGIETAVQRFGYIDSNVVKNFRNRLTAASLVLWQRSLGGTAVAINQHPWLASDMPFTVYLGMAMLPMTVCLGASILGGILTAQDFEEGTIVEYRLSPVSPQLILGGRLARVVMVALGGGATLLLALGLVTGHWPNSVIAVLLLLVPIGVIAGTFGIFVGLWLQRSLPVFVVALGVTFMGWLAGSAFGLAAGFGHAYELVSRLTPNTHTVMLLFPRFYGVSLAGGRTAVVALTVQALLTSTLMVWSYRRRVLAGR